MRSGLARFIYYSATTVPLLFLALWLQHFLDQLFLQHGMSDVATLSETLDGFSALPIFGDWRWAAGALVVGGVAYLLVILDRRGARAETTSLVRASFLAALVMALGLRTLFAATLITQQVTLLSKANLPIALPLAGFVAWGAALILTLIEWRLGGAFTERAVDISLLGSLIGQWTLALATIWAVTQTLQSLLQNAVAPLPQCSSSLDVVTQFVTFISRLFQQCTDLAPWPDAALTLVAIAGAWVVYAFWSKWSDGEANTFTIVLTNCDAVFGGAVAGLVVLYGVVLGLRFVTDLIIGQPGAEAPQSLLTTPGMFGVSSYPFVGALLAGCCVLVVYLLRSRVWLANDKYQLAYVYALATVEMLLNLAFFIGAAWMLGDAFVALAPALTPKIEIPTLSVSPSDWYSGVIFFIPGLLGNLFVAHKLHEKPDVNAATNKRELPFPYFILYRVSFVGSFLALAFSLLLFLSTLAAEAWGILPPGILADLANYFAAHFLSFALIALPFVLYYRSMAAGTIPLKK